MKRVIFAAVSTVAGLTMLLSFKTRATPTAAATNPAVSAGTPGPSTPSTSGTTTVTGSASNTRYGPVQVKITVTNGQVTAVQAVEYPQESRRDEQINAYAIPVLNQEATAAKTAKIDMVSGATYTSSGYINSLQNALNKAGLS